MDKKFRLGHTLKDQLRAAAADRLYRFTLADNMVRGALIHGARMIYEMRANHQLGVLETLALGHAYLAAGLMAAGLKGNDRVKLQIECSGPIQGLIVEANAFGEVRGYLKQVPIPIQQAPADFDLSPFFGAGLMRVTRHLERAKAPFEGRIALQYGNIGQDLAHYYLTSEQIPTAVYLSIEFDADGRVVGAGGLLLQAMPGADDQTMADLETQIVNLPSLGKQLAANPDGHAFVTAHFNAYQPRLLTDYRVEFMCHCSRKKTAHLLAMLPLDQLQDIAKNGPFPLQMRCHHCNSSYGFDQTEIGRICAMRFARN